MRLALLPAPWSFFEPHSHVDLASPPSAHLSWHVLPRLFAQELPPTFLCNRARPLLAAGTREADRAYYHVPWPEQPSSQTVLVRPGADDVILRVPTYLNRAASELRDAHAAERWLNWQYHVYTELARSSSRASPLEARTRHGARRIWSTVRDALSDTREARPEISLIVELADDRRLLTAISRIAQSPRRVLAQSYRQVRLSRARGMDHHTLRTLVQRPGRSIAEKAGPRQRLLSVVRHETFDVTENRVFVWCLRRIVSMAKAWCDRNRDFRRTDRFRAVATLGRLSERVLTSALFASVLPLQHHLVTPTYCLQLDRHYRVIWNTYTRIRRNDRAIDDLWMHQSHLWSATGRLVLGALLLSMPGWEEPLQSTLYFRAEAEHGAWLSLPAAPGPLRTPHGPCMVLDTHDRLVFPWASAQRMPEVALDAGADWILALPDSRTILLFWIAVLAAHLDRDGLRGQLARLGQPLREHSRRSGWRLRGFVLLADPHGSYHTEGTDAIENESAIAVVMPRGLPGDVRRITSALNGLLRR